MIPRDKVFIALISDKGRILIDLAELYDKPARPRQWQLESKKGNSWFNLQLLDDSDGFLLFKLTINESYRGTDGIDTRITNLHTHFIVIDITNRNDKPYDYTLNTACPIKNTHYTAVINETRLNTQTSELQFDLSDYKLKFDEI